MKFMKPPKVHDHTELTINLTEFGQHHPYALAFMLLMAVALAANWFMNQ